MIDIRFAFPLAFLLLIPLVILGIRWWRGLSTNNALVLQYSDTRLLSGLPVSLRTRIRRTPDLLRLLAWILLLVALARPQSAAGQEIIRGAGIDVAIALDISDSMGEPDYNGTRLDAAKSVLRTFILARPFDRIGLVVFADNAYLQSPLSLDHRTLNIILSEIQLAGSLGLGNRTAIGLGIASAVNVLRHNDGTSRVIILLTDGANNTGDIDPISAAQAARVYDTRIYTVGIGTTASLSENTLDEGTLQQIADITSGRYYRAESSEDLTSIYESINQLETNTREQQIRTVWQDQASLFIWMAFILLVIERLLRHSIFQTIP